MLKVTVDGIAVEVENGTTVLKAAQKAGVHIPTFCNDDRLAPTGACRMCLVEIEGGPPRLFASCVLPATDNMVVKTNSPKIAGARKTNLELLLVHHPLDCPSCPAAGACGLQDLTYEFGLQTSRFRAFRKESEPDISNPCIEQNNDRCVLCSKCIRVCDEIQGVGAIGLVRRGFNSYVGTPFGNDLNCDFCGHCVITCPVGARNSRFMMKGRAWNVRSVNAVCSFCGTGCALRYDVRDRENMLVQARAVDGMGISGNFQCSKGWQGFSYVNSPDRLTKPLMRAGEKLAPVQWDDALGEITRNLKKIIKEHGPGAVAGIGSERLTNEDNYLFQKFFRTVIGSNKVDNILNMKTRAMGEGLPKTLGGGIRIAPLDTLERTPLIFLIGADPTSESPVVGNMIRRAVTNLNADLLYAHSRDTRVSRIASVSMVYKVGTEAALLNGIINEILTKGLIPEKTASARVENLGELKSAVSRYIIDMPEKVAGVGSEEIEQAARALAEAEGTVFLLGREMTERPSNEAAMEALKNLVLLTGNGGGKDRGLMLFREFNNSQGVNDVGVTPMTLPGYQPVDDPSVRVRFEEAWGKPLPPFEQGTDIIQQAIDGKIKAMYIMGDDPVTRYIDGQKIREALGNIDFIICQDVFLTESCSYADVVLPGVTFAEKTGTTTNMEGRVQRSVRQISPVGEALPDSEILSKIAGRMGGSLSPVPEQALEELSRLSPIHAGVSESADGKEGAIINLGGLGVTPNGRAKIVPFNPPDQPSDDFPFALVTGNLLHHLGPFSRKSEALNAVSPGCFVEISPMDNKALGIKEGDMCVVESVRGRLNLPARIKAASPRGVVFIPINFEDAPVNMLISGDEAVTRVRVLKA